MGLVKKANTCNGLLSKLECLATLKQYSKGKSPGTDGLTAECYQAFWELIKADL